MTRFEFTYEPPTARLLIAGDLDLSTADQLGDAMRRMASDGYDHIRLDLDEILFIDAHSLGLLDTERRRLARHGGDLSVRSASARYRRVALLAGYDNLQPTPA